MIIDPEMARAIRLQRTGLRGKPGPQIAGEYAASQISAFNLALPSLPTQCNRILDIGCGLGGMGLLLSRHYSGRPELVMLDGSETSLERRYGYGSGGEFYADLRQTERFLEDNGVTPDRVRTVDILTQGFPEGPFDLITSFVSWGFHYPIGIYAERVKRALSPGGTLILEVRKNSPAEHDVLIFGEPEILADLPKRKMLAFRLGVID